MPDIKMHTLRIVMVAAGLSGCGQGFAQAPVPPPQAIAAGFNTLAFSDEFSVDSFTSAATTRLWWESFHFFPPPVGIIEMLPGGGVVRLTTPGKSPHTHLVNHPVNDAPYGDGYLFGYFEARMRFLPGTNADVANSWGAFWLFSKLAIENNVSNADGSKTWCEIDVAEMYRHGLLNTTIHSWHQPDGGTPQDTFNPVHLNVVSGDPIDGNWHTFGLLWRPGVVTWYMDDVQVTTYAHSYPVCDTQPMTPVLSVQSLAEDPQTADVDWVRIWK